MGGCQVNTVSAQMVSMAMLALLGQGEPLAAQSPVWQVGPEPLMRIGDSPEDGRYQLDRVSAALWLGADGLVIANGGDELRFYDGGGRFRATAGRSGEGPGEFRALAWLGEYGDSMIAAYDQRLQRVSFMRRDGEFLHSFPLNDLQLGVGPRVAGVLDDGLLTLWLMPPEIPERGGISRSCFRLAVHDPGGDLVRVLGEGPAREAFLFAVPGRGNVLRRAPFSPTAVYAAQGGRVYRSDGLSYSVEITDALGRVLAVAGDPHERVTLSDSMKEAFLRDTLQAWPSGERRRVEASLRLMMVHEHLPLVSDMRVDRSGHVWLQRRAPEGPSAYWDVFSATGEAVARLELPANRQVLDITRDHIVLLQSGQYGEDLVSVHALRR